VDMGAVNVDRSANAVELYRGHPGARITSDEHAAWVGICRVTAAVVAATGDVAARADGVTSKARAVAARLKATAADLRRMRVREGMWGMLGIAMARRSTPEAEKYQYGCPHKSHPTMRVPSPLTAVDLTARVKNETYLL
jgi:hypothetical protein